MSSVLGPLVPPLLPLLLLLLLLLLCDDTSSLRTPRRVRPPPSSLQMLNRLMVHPHEVSAAGNKVCIPLSDPRAQHAATILRCRDGDALRVGVLDEGVDDAAVVRWVWPAGYSHGWLDADGDNGPLRGVGGRGRPGKPPKQEVQPEALELTVNLAPPPYPRSRVDLILALPRPLQLQRMLPMISSLGVDTLVLCNAAKVEKDYFGSHLIRDPEARIEALVEGLAQSGDIHL